MAISWLWVSCLGFQVTPDKMRWVSCSVTFSFSGYFLLGLTWGEVWEEGLCVKVQFLPWMVDDVDWSSIFKQGMIRKQWSKTRLGNLNEKPCLLQLKIELLRHCSRGDIYSSLCFLYLLIIFSTFSIVTPTLDHIISSGKLVGTEWKISVLICHSQVNRLEVRCSVQFSSVQSLSHVRLFATPWTTARQAFLSITNSWSPPKTMSIELVMPSNHLLCHPLLLLLSIFPSIRVFSKESALRIRWPKYWSFSFKISPTNEHPGLIFRMDWLDLLAAQGTLKSLLQQHSSIASILRCILFLLLLHEISSLPEVWHWNFLQHSFKVFFHF